MIYELKRYKIRPGNHEAFLEVWKDIADLRKRHGYDILFALFDRESGWFTWAVAHSDFDAAARRYYADPDRIALEIVSDHIEDHEIRRVDFIPTP